MFLKTFPIYLSSWLLLMTTFQILTNPLVSFVHIVCGVFRGSAVKGKKRRSSTYIFLKKKLSYKDIQCCISLLFFSFRWAKPSAYCLMKSNWNYHGQAKGYRLVASSNYIFSFPYSASIKSQMLTIWKGPSTWCWRCA